MSTGLTSDTLLRPAWLANWPIGRKLALNAAVPLLMFAAFTAWIEHKLSQIQRSVSDTVIVDVEFALRIKDMQMHIVQVQQFLQDVSATRGLDGLDDGFAKASGQRDEFMRTSRELHDYLAGRYGQAKLDELERVQRDFETYYARGRQMAEAYVREGPAGGNPMMSGFDQTADALLDSMTRLRGNQIEKLKAELNAVDQSALGMRRAAPLLGLVMMGSVLFLTFVISRALIRPIRVAAEVAQRIASGDLRHQFLPKGRDEIGEMLGSLGRMQDHLRNLVVQVRSGVGEVNAASGQMALASNDLSGRTEQQAAALQQTTAALAQLNDAVQRNATSAAQVDRQAQRAAKVATQGGSAMAEVVQAMQEIEASARRTGDIVGTIDGIAFQTNILALNAAVEAAQAGEHGRGFAVVAGEVRLLAGRAGEAAREIRGLLERSAEQVGSGMHKVGEARATIDEVVGAIGEMSGQVQDINTASQAQSRSLAELVQAVGGIDQHTQSNAAMVEQTAANAEELRDQARQLVDAVEAFTLGEAARPPAPD